MKKTKKKKINKRSANPFAAFDPRLNLKSRYDEIIDIASYAHTLSDKDKKWLAAFVEEEVNANFNHEGKKLNKTKKAKREIYNRNNRRNRDVFTRAKIQNSLLNIDTVYKNLENKYGDGKLKQASNFNNPSGKTTKNRNNKG